MKPLRRTTILMLLQNQWFKNPERIERTISFYKDRKGEEPGRTRFIRDMLFLGCLTGRRIKEAFGEPFYWEGISGESPRVTVVYDEVSPLIGGHSGSAFPPDEKHLNSVVDYWRPRLVIAFGRLSLEGLEFASVKAKIDRLGAEIIHAPHPAARGSDTVSRLKRAAETAHKWINNL